MTVSVPERFAIPALADSKLARLAALAILAAVAVLPRRLPTPERAG